MADGSPNIQPKLQRKPQVGDIRVGRWDEYEPGQAGFVIEQLTYGASYLNDEPFWAIPAWDERGQPGLAGVFATYAEAERAMREPA